jgi:YidB-like protein
MATRRSKNLKFATGSVVNFKLRLADALGGDTLDALSRQTGMRRQDLLGGLSQHLPDFVDQLTPEGGCQAKRKRHEWSEAVAELRLGWCLAIVGIMLKLALSGQLDRLSIGLYLLLSWSVIIACEPLAAALPRSTLWLWRS